MARLGRAVPKGGLFLRIEVSNELNYESFKLALHKAFGHAADPAAAYEQLRRRLIRIFLNYGHSIDAESLADDVIDRVLKRIYDDSVEIEGKEQVSRYALGVARNVNLEQRRKHELRSNSYLVALHQDDFLEAERRSKALEICLKNLKPNERKLLTEYYGNRRGETKRFAAELGISHENLRVRVLRLKQRLKEMMDQYLNS